MAAPKLVRYYNNDGAFRVMKEGNQFVVEQDCGTAGWWACGFFAKLELATAAIEVAKKEIKDKTERVQVWPPAESKTQGKPDGK